MEARNLIKIADPIAGNPYQILKKNVSLIKRMKTVYCGTKNKYFIYIFTILFQVILLFTFLVIFYFNYVNQVEKNAFISQIHLAVDDLTGNLKDIIKYLSTDAKQAIIVDINTEIQNIKKNANHAQIDKNNNHLENLSFELILSILAGFCVFIVVVTMGNYCLPLLSTAKEGLLSLAFVALTEFIFLQIVAKNYISADPNLIRYNISKALNKDAKKFINSSQ